MEAETWQPALHQVAVLNARQTAFTVVIGYLQPRHFPSVLPRCQAAPANHSFIQLPLVVEKPAGLGREPGTKEELLVALGVERLWRLRFLWLILREDDIMFVGEPATGIKERPLPASP